MNDHEEKIRAKAYEIWESRGRTGNPEDHWFEAEREIRSASANLEDRSEATVEDAPPAASADAVEAIEAGSGKGTKRPAG